jgi:ABC-type cobalamin/Fe3+-siderophores transport system ATPase subunit
LPKNSIEFTGRKTNCFNWSKWNWEINLASNNNRIQKPLSGTIALNGKKYQIDALTVAQNLSVVTEKLPPSNLTVFELIALGRQPYTNWIGKLTDTDIAKVNEAMELNQSFVI